MNEGDEMLFVTPSGGGYGDPLEREPALVLLDWQDELLSTEDAAAAYGVLIDGHTRTVDEAATVARREVLRSKESV
jgi:N-methylhydantoinase B